jgi:hypothetical protein
MDYKEKYLKYKKKYLILKNQLGGLNCNNIAEQACFEKRGCVWKPKKTRNDPPSHCQKKHCDGRIKFGCDITKGCKWIPKTQYFPAYCGGDT